jgi:hypothetical protein
MRPDVSVAIVNTMWRPSGDQSMLLASPTRCVICRRCVPFGRTVNTWLPDAVDAVNAISPFRPGTVADALLGTPMPATMTHAKKTFVLVNRRIGPSRGLVSIIPAAGWRT